MQRHLELAVDAPLGARLDGVDRFARLDFHGAQQPAAALGKQQQVGKHDQLANRDRLVLLIARIDDDFVLALVAGLQLADDTVMLELLADRPGENRAHYASGI